MRIWKLALENFPDIPRPEDHGWTFSDGYLEPLWCVGDILPKDVQDLASQECDDDEILSCDEESDSSEDSETDTI